MFEIRYVRCSHEDPMNSLGHEHMPSAQTPLFKHAGEQLPFVGSVKDVSQWMPVYELGQVHVYETLVVL